MKINKLLLALAGLTLVVCSCKKDDTLIDNGGLTDPNTVVAFVSNEGGFNKNNASLSAIELDGDIANELYLGANNVAPGDILQSLAITDKYILLAVNNSQKVEIIDRNTFKSVKVLDGLSTYPRYITIDGDKAYVSNGSFAGQILTIDLNTLEWVGTGVNVGNGPERMLLNNNTLLVTNSGGFTSDSTLSIIDLSSGSVNSIELSIRPTDLVTNGTRTWVLCAGKAIYAGPPNYEIIDHIGAKLFELDAAYNIVNTTAFADSTVHPSNLEISPDGNTLYTAHSSTVYSTSTSSINWTSLATLTGVYGLSVHPSNGTIYATDAGNYSDAGFVYHLDANGTILKTLSAGIGTGGVYFTE